MNRLLAAISVTAIAGAVLAAAPADASLARMDPQGGSPLRFTLIQYNSPGPDHGGSVSLNAEWVTILNPTGIPRRMTGMHIHDAGSIHRYTFKPFTLGPHKSVRLHTGHGTDGPLNKYWNQSGYVWNNDKDTATLTQPSGIVIDACSWSDPSELHNQKRC